jgi:hypothetical protein
MVKTVYKRQRRRRAEPSKKGLAKAEQYVRKIREGCGSWRFKTWLSSMPLDAYACLKVVDYGFKKIKRSF